MTHAPGCTMPTPETDPSGHLRCPSCKYIQPTPRGGKASTGYVCRDHHDQPVTWRGTGCPACIREAKKRKAPQPSDDYEMEMYR